MAIRLSLRVKLEEIDNLPTIPAVAVKIMKLARSSKSSVQDIARVIKLDHSLLTKIIKLVNSAYFSRGNKVSKVEQAVSILGLENIKNLALSTSVFSAMQKRNLSGFDHNGYWEHCIGVGFIADIIVNEMRLKGLEDIFVCGIVHDVGKAVLSEFFTSDIEIVTDEISRQNCSFFQAEKNLLGYDHTEIGEYLCSLWNFPDNIIQSIRHHHNPLQAPRDNKSASIIYLANILCKISKFGFSGDNIVPYYIPEQVFEKAGITEDDYESIKDKINDKRDQFDEILMDIIN